MAKHPVPKKKTSKARTSRRYKAFQNRTRARLGNSVQVIICPSCSSPVQQHRACESCGKYKGKDMNQSSTAKVQEAAKVQTIQAD